MTSCGAAARAVWHGAMRMHASQVLQIYVFPTEKHRFQAKCFAKISTKCNLRLAKHGLSAVWLYGIKFLSQASGAQN